MHRTISVFAVAILLLGASSMWAQAAHGCNYSDININGFVTAINDSGSMVGVSGSGGFFLSKGKMSRFSFPGGRGTAPSNISNTAQIVGSYEDRTNPEIIHGFSVLNGTFHSINFPGASTTNANGNNSQGDIVGSFTGSSVGANGFLLRKGKFTVIHVPGASQTSVSGINKFGTMAGTYTDAHGRTHGFTLKNGVIKTLNFPGAIHTTVFKINDAGVIVGGYNLPGQNADHSYLLVKGKYINVDDPKASDTFATGLNNVHKIVGNYISKDRLHQPSFVATCTAVF